MGEVLNKLLKLVSGITDMPKGAYNIRVDGDCGGRQNTEGIRIESKSDKPGIDIYIDPGVKKQKVYIPACITHGAVDDLVYNDFYIGENSDVTIVAGCGIHSEDEEDSQHNGIHRFFVGKGAHCVYLEKHIGVGKGSGKRIINPVTEIEMQENSLMEMDTIQIKGVDSTVRKLTATLGANAKLMVKEKIMTHGAQTAKTEFEVTLDGDNCGADLISRSVARDDSVQHFYSRLIGNAASTGHTECDAIIMDHGVVEALPALIAKSADASLIHEAAIGKIAGEQIMKLMTLGLDEREAEEKIIEGFLK